MGPQSLKLLRYCIIVYLQLLQHWLGIGGRSGHNTRNVVEFSSCGVAVISSSGGGGGGGGGGIYIAIVSVV